MFWPLGAVLASLRHLAKSLSLPSSRVVGGFVLVRFIDEFFLHGDNMVTRVDLILQSWRFSPVEQGLHCLAWSPVVFIS